MKPYHASNLIVDKPIIVNRFKTLDFGTGFYTTTNEPQAQEFAKKVHLRRRREGSPSSTCTNMTATSPGRPFRSSNSLAPTWSGLNSLPETENGGRDEQLAVDIVIGPVANDDVFETVALYEAGLIDAQAAIAKFKVKSLYDQMLFCNEKALGFLSFERSYEAGDPK